MVVPVHVLPIRLVVDFVAAAATEERQSQRWQQANSAAVAVTFLQAQHEEATRLAGVRKSGYRKQKIFLQTLLMVCCCIMLLLSSLS